MTKNYNKLVRDKIPQIILRDGKQCTTRILNENEYLDALNSKLSEELNEYLQSGSIEELADLLEVVHASALAHGHTLRELEAVRQAKRDERGGFDKKIYLETVSDGDDKV